MYKQKLTIGPKTKVPKNRYQIEVDTYKGDMDRHELVTIYVDTESDVRWVLS
jgi:hypothetical protein